MRALSVVLAVLAVAAPANAADLTTVGDGTVRETALGYDVHLDGLVARVTARHELRGTGGAAEAVYRFALPAEAAIVGLAVTLPEGAPQRGAAVDAIAAIDLAADRDTVAIAPDLGLVRRLGATEPGGDVAYELRIYPIGAGAATVVEVSWIAPVALVDGRLALRVPARGAEGGDAPLAEASGRVKVTPPAGVKAMRDLRVGGVLAVARPGKKAHTWGRTAGELRIEVTPVLRGAIATFTAAPVGDDGGALVVATLRPRVDAAPARFGRVVFVVDASASAAGDPEAREAAATLVAAITAGLRDDAAVQAILFDRAARAALDRFVAPTLATRDALRAAIRGADGGAGSDVAGALAEARRVIDADAEERGDTLVVVVTDGVLPTDATAAALAAGFGERDDVTISAVLLGPDDLALPDPRAGALAELAAARGGHVVAVRRGEAAARAGTIADEVGGAPDWYVRGVRAGAAELSLRVPDAIGAGGGFLVAGWYRGKAPRKLTLETSEGTLTARAARLAGAVALAIAGGSEAPMAATIKERAALERTAAVVTDLTSLVAVDRTDELAAARLDLAARGGTFARIPPPPERDAPVRPATIADVVDVGARYQLDLAARIRVDLLRPQLLPAVRACVRDALGAGGVKPGRLHLEIEIARGEVMTVRATAAGAPAPLLDCLRDAGYALQVPTYTLADGADSIHLIRYPIDYRASAVAIGDDAPVPIELGDTDTPLGDLEPR